MYFKIYKNGIHSNLKVNTIFDFFDFIINLLINFNYLHIRCVLSIIIIIINC